MERRATTGGANLERERQFDALLCLISTVQALQGESGKRNKKDGHSEPRKNPSGEEIKQRAYQIFLARGGVQGSEVEDWLQAERELLDKVRKDHSR